MGIELVIFCCFASGDEQPWNKSIEVENDEEEEEENQIELQKLSSRSPADDHFRFNRKSEDDQSINQAFFEITCNKPINKQITMKGVYVAKD